MSTRGTVAVTGANGYVGGLVAKALADYSRVVPLVRVPREPDAREWGFDTGEADMIKILRQHSVRHVIHTAWDMRENSLERVRSTCVLGTQCLLNAAKAVGVESFIFISTISAFEGARSAYGRSKFEAEMRVLATGGLVLRLGLVYGEELRGVFGSLVTLATHLAIVPALRGGPGSQYLLHEHSLSSAITRAVKGDFAAERRVITLAHPNPVRLTELMKAVAKSKQHKALFVPLPWIIPYGVLRFAELLRLPLRLRSDSLVSFIYQNPKPDFAPLSDHRIEMLPFTLLA